MAIVFCWLAFSKLRHGRAVLKNLYRAGFRRVAAINASAGGTQVKHNSR
jgi:hypothetical protein